MPFTWRIRVRKQIIIIINQFIGFQNISLEDLSTLHNMFESIFEPLLLLWLRFINIFWIEQFLSSSGIVFVSSQSTILSCHHQVLSLIVKYINFFNFFFSSNQKKVLNIVQSLFTYMCTICLFSSKPSTVL